MKNKLFLLGAFACLAINANATNYVYISSAEDFVKFRNAVNTLGTVKAQDDETLKNCNVPAATANVVLTNDIDLENTYGKGKSWKPIGATSERTFSGVFNGNNHTIYNFTIDTTKIDKYQGLFGYSSGTIKNVILKGSIKTGQYVGGIVGYMNGGSIYNCVNYSNIVCPSGNYVGGICGHRNGAGKIIKCLNYGSIEGGTRVGGIAGKYNDTLSYCANYASVKGTSIVGGLVGDFASNVLLKCFNVGRVINGAPLTGNQSQKTTSIATYISNNADLMQGTIAGVSAKDFSSGKIAYLYNKDSVVWKQTLGADPYPVLNGKIVYAYQTEDGDTLYANSMDTIVSNESIDAVIWPSNKPYTPANNNFLITTNASIAGHNVVIKGEDGTYTCNEFHLADGKAFYTPIDFAVGKLTYNRPATTSKIITIVLPVTMPTDYLKGTLYVFDKFDGKNVHFSVFQDDIVEANKPYAIMPESDETEILENGAKNATIVADMIKAIEIDGLENFGTYEHDTLYSDTHYSNIAFSGGALKRYKKLNLSPFRAAFRLDLDHANTSETFGLILDNELTGVLLTENDQEEIGHVNVYDVQGHLVRSHAEPTTCFQGLKNGIYIVNGTKFNVNSGIQTITTTKTLKHASASTGVAE